jgi:flagellar basal body-associated protein FliL
MQTWSGQNPGGTLSSTRKLLTIVIVAFSLAGLIAGFAIGGLTGSKPTTTTAGTPGPRPKQTVAVQNTVTVTPKPTVQPIVKLDPPKTLNISATAQKADGTTSYTLTIQVIDKQNKQPVHAPGITCKAWLVQRIPAGQKMDIDTNTLKAVTSLTTTPIQGTLNPGGQPVTEISGLTFVSPTTQTAPSNADGQVTWKYTIAPTVAPGDYDLVILTDWQGVRFNWSWDDITIH